MEVRGSRIGPVLALLALEADATFSALSAILWVCHPQATTSERFFTTVIDANRSSLDSFFSFFFLSFFFHRFLTICGLSATTLVWVVSLARDLLPFVPGECARSLQK